MHKKIVLLIILVLLSGCVNSNTTVEPLNDNKYIEPINDSFLFSELDNNLQAKIKTANGNKDYENYQFSMIDKKIYEKDLIDINGSVFNFHAVNTCLLEVVSVDCGHCKDMVKDHINSMSNNEISLVQYFNVGTVQDIKSFYSDLQINIPNNVIIIPKDEGMDDYVRKVLGAKSYPTLVAYYNGLVSFNTSGYLDDKQLDSFYDCGFINRIDFKSLKNSEGEYLLQTIRTDKDVENSFSEENLQKLKDLDNDNNSKSYTIKLIGNKLNFDLISNNKSSVYINEIDDFNEYKDSNLVLIYTYLKDENDFSKVEFINSLIDSNKNVEYIVVLIEGLDSSSSAYRKMNNKFNCKVVSVLGYCPDDFFKLGISNYPTAIFVEKSTFTGAYSNIDSIDNFNLAISMFIGDNSIALKANN